MLRKRLFIFTLLALLASPVIADPLGNTAHQKSLDDIMELIETKKYEFIKRFSNETDFLRIKSNQAIADLPHIGRVFSGITTGGIRFDGTIKNYKVELDTKKNKVRVNFKVKGYDDTYTCTLLISSLDSVSLSIASNNRPVIYYSGHIQTYKENQ